MRNQMKNTVKNQKDQKNQKQKTGYTYVEKNIYNTGVSYRVRVGSQTINVKSLKKAREWKKTFKSTNDSFVW